MALGDCVLYSSVVYPAVVPVNVDGATAHFVVDPQAVGVQVNVIDDDNVVGGSVDAAVVWAHHLV